MARRPNKNPYEGKTKEEAIEIFLAKKPKAELAEWRRFFKSFVVFTPDEYQQTTTSPEKSRPRRPSSKR